MSVSIDSYKYKSQSKSSTVKIIEAKFGDGYVQRTVDGINYNKERFNVQFIPMDATSSLALETILKDSVKTTADVLTLTPKGETTTKYYVAKDVRKQTLTTDWFQITCTLERDFPII